MKVFRFKLFTLALIAISLLVSCQATNNLTMSVTEPAPIYLPSSIENIGLLNRSLASEKNKPLDAIDQILSIEGKNLDKEGATYTLQSIKDTFEKDDHYQSIVIINSDKIENPGLGIFPSALPWKTVETLCRENNLDAIIALSFYDTDAKVDYKTRTVEQVNAFGIKIPMIEHQATITTNIKAGFRVYDNVNKLIRDEMVTDQWISSTGKGINPSKALEAIAGRKQALLQTSTNIGNTYALRTYPYKIRVTRQYYVKGTDNFEIGKRRAQTGDWDGAAELWEKELNNPKGKIAGRACYNMGIINEINGDLEAAISWVSKSYTDYEDKNALRYLNILRYRQEQNKQLEAQSQ
jgi:hypothetical protein